jgi:DNA-binding GntR family transcriptional regulator
MKFLDNGLVHDQDTSLMMRSAWEGTTRKLVNISLSNAAYARIKAMIAEHRFLPGSRLNVEELARNLGASRTPIWEAVRKLEQEGLLRSVPNRGVFLVELTRKAAIELYSVREVLEGMAARLAVAQITEKSLQKMERSLRKQEAIVQQSDLVAYSREDFCFHELIYAASGNAFLQEILEGIAHKARPIGMQITPILFELLSDHRNIVSALRQRDPVRAETAFREHIGRMLALFAPAENKQSSNVRAIGECDPNVFDTFAAQRELN